MTNDPKLSYQQQKLLHVLFREAGIVDRDARLAVTSQWVGRQVDSSTDLSVGEASIVIDQLKEELGMPAREWISR